MILNLGILQRMDDMRPDASFEDVSALHAGARDGGRRQYNVTLPYRLYHHGHNHTIYTAGEVSIR